jgi:hypothetical protein
VGHGTRPVGPCCGFCLFFKSFSNFSTKNFICVSAQMCREDLVGLSAQSSAPRESESSGCREPGASLRAAGRPKAAPTPTLLRRLATKERMAIGAFWTS